jgi:hypothetical protein
VQPRFELIRLPEDAGFQQLADCNPENPFATPAFARGQLHLGFTPCLAGIWAGNELQTGCIASFKKGRLSGSLEIRFLPDLPDNSPFLPGLVTACKAMRVWDLTVYAVTAKSNPVPALGRVTFEERGTEFHLRLGDTPDPACMSSNHRRNLTKAEKSGVTLHRSVSPVAIAPHVTLMNLSMERRTVRGEEVSANIREFYFRQMLVSGAAEFFQARAPDGTMLSSIFLLRSASGAYYQSAGTSPQGMSLGASPFLIWRAAELLRREGVTCFSIGGTTHDNEGLLRFKNSFGGVPLPFQEQTFSLAHPILRRLRDLFTNLRRLIKRA